MSSNFLAAPFHPAELPTIEIVEEGMREGMQIESAAISVDHKLELLGALSVTGLRRIVVGSFVSPKWTPQMANIDELVSRMEPVAGVEYVALALNERGRARMRAFIPPLSDVDDGPQTLVHLCDVFVRRNTNRSQRDEMDEWPRIIARAREEGATHASIAINAAWGSNWTGGVTEAQRMEMLERQHRLWTEAGIAVTRVWIGDPMGWNMPHHVGSQIRALRERWPDITTFHLHLHDARGTALVSAYEAMRSLGPEHRLVLDSSIGGMGGCPYGGHGRMTRMMATEDLVDFLSELGVDTGIDIDRLIDAAALAEEVVGHSLWGHVSKAGPRPRGERAFPLDLPFIETEREAQHFRLGPDVYQGARSPWATPISSVVSRDATSEVDS